MPAAPTPTPPAPAASDAPLPRRAVVTVFLAFASTYFLSALLRAVTATLSPALTEAFALHARDLGLLAGGYFLGFAAMQLPLGAWLDRHGPRRVMLGLLTLAVAGCALFALAQGFGALLLARVLMGMGVSACLMGPLTGYRRWLAPTLLLRANAWMLMSGSLGMLASTLPVQWLLPVLGWCALFWGLAGLMLLGMAALALAVPRWQPRPANPANPAHPAPATPSAGQGAQTGAPAPQGYAAVWRNPVFRRAVPLGGLSYGGMVAVQTLWAGPWMTQVAGLSPAQAAAGLFVINAGMLLAFWSWGLWLPRLAARGVRVDTLVARVQPFSFVLLAALVAGGGVWGALTPGLLMLYCVLTTPCSHVQTTVGMAFAPAMAGRALSAFNLVIFAGVFIVQWGLGLCADALQAQGWAPASALRGALGIFGLISLGCWLRFVRTAPR